MKTLYLARHAKSSWKNMSLDDHDRPLNERGKRSAPEMGQRLDARGISPDLWISSTAKRARSTARKFAKKMKVSKSQINLTPELYHADEMGILKIIQQQPENVETVILFGHNPGFTDCANLLCNADIFNIPTAGVVAIQFDIKKWQDVLPGSGTLVFFDYPKKSN